MQTQSNDLDDEDVSRTTETQPKATHERQTHRSRQCNTTDERKHSTPILLLTMTIIAFRANRL
jgi:hypothetical protein